MDITEKLGAYVKAREVTGNGASTHCCDTRDAITEINQLRAEVIEWKQTAQVEAGLKREFRDKMFRALPSAD